MEALQSWLERQSPRSAQLWALASIAVIGFVQYLSGPEIAFSIFYVLPLVLFGWKVGRGAAAVLCALAAIVWASAEVSAGARYGDLWIVLWNGTSRFIVFLIVVSLRAGLERQEELAGTDALTGVGNNRSFHRAASRAIDSFHQEPSPLTLCYLDVDDFKAVNDTLGHSGGDEALLAIASALRATIRQDDVVARMGGDEFALLLPRTGTEGARSLLRDLQDRVERAAAELPRRVTFSIGAATFLVPPASVDEMIKAADTMMYSAKREGKATYQHVTIGADSEDAVPDVSEPRGARVPI